VITLVVLLIFGLVAMALVRPERFREMGEDVMVVELDGSHQTEAGLIGSCLSVFRRIGPLSLIVANDVLPGDDWDRGPFNGCEAVGHLDADIHLPESVGSGDWMLCDAFTCHQLVPGDGR
jgi:hypothetical protein